MNVVPTGAHHEVGIDDLFFSTTDSRGVIEQANKVFVDIARTPRDVLIGAPHNIIRHPEMPGGAFRIVWETIGAKQPVCAYVHNLAGDGSGYWAFATITPLDNGYLSVRSRPCNAELHKTVDEIYQRVRSAEQQHLSKGSTPPKTARIGQTLLLEELAKLGYDSYAAFMYDVLPAEIAARAAAGGKMPERPGASGVPAMMLNAVSAVDARVRALNARLEGADEIASALDKGVHLVKENLSALEAALQDAQVLVEERAEDAPLLANATPAIEAQCHKVGETLQSVLTHVEETHALRRELHFAACLAQMQAETCGHFAVAVIDGDEDAATTQHATESLISALTTGVDGVSRALIGDREQVALLGAEIKAGESAMRITGMLIAKWRELVQKYRLQDEMAGCLPAIDSALAALTDNLVSLHTAAEQFGASAVAFDPSELEADLERVSSLSQSMAAYRQAA